MRQVSSPWPAVKAHDHILYRVTLGGRNPAPLRQDTCNLKHSPFKAPLSMFGFEAWMGGAGFFGGTLFSDNQR